jgi:hypothetical protein
MENLTTIETNQNWSHFQKIAFRFCFIFFALHNFNFPIGEIPVVGEWISEQYENLWDKLVNWGGKLFFSIPEITIKPAGSGDTTWNWVQEFLILLLSALCCVIWSLFDRKRPNYQGLNYWNNVWIRYCLGFTMLTYGIVKVFPSQFGTITSYRLYQQLGDMSPMGLLWTFMAHSTSYQFFAGLMECLGGALLLFRKTRLLGALISVGVMVNVFALNMCYDVPVKLYSFLLVLMALYLTAPDFKQLLNFFILQKPTTVPPQYQPSFSDKKGYKIGRIVLKLALILGLVTPLVLQMLESEDKRAEPLSAFYGPYSVSKHIKNNVDLPLTDSLRWEKFFIDRRGAYNIIFVSNEMGVRDRINFEKNDSTKTIKFSTVKDTTKYLFTYQQPDTTTLILNGKFGKDSLHIELLKQKNKDFLLVKRGFHWINEYPFNK